MIPLSRWWKFPLGGVRIFLEMTHLWLITWACDLYFCIKMNSQMLSYVCENCQFPCHRGSCRWSGLTIVFIAGFILKVGGHIHTHSVKNDLILSKLLLTKTQLTVRGKIDGGKLLLTASYWNPWITTFSFLINCNAWCQVGIAPNPTPLALQIDRQMDVFLYMLNSSTKANLHEGHVQK